MVCVFLTFHPLSNDIIILSSTWPHSHYEPSPLFPLISVFPIQRRHQHMFTDHRSSQLHHVSVLLHVCVCLVMKPFVLLRGNVLLCCFFNPGSEPLLPLPHLPLCHLRKREVFGSLSLPLLFTLLLLISP